MRRGGSRMQFGGSCGHGVGRVDALNQKNSSGDGEQRLDSVIF